MTNTYQYDYIICGAGCAGQSLLMRLLADPFFSEKKILLVEKDAKTANDRTWCFWEKEAGFFEDIVHRRWSGIWFHSSKWSRLLDIAPYTYKMIRGIDFYNHCFRIIRQHANVRVLQGTVSAVDTEPGAAAVVVDGQRYTAEYVFNSIVFERPALQRKEHYLLQHFKGWVIETKEAVFHPGEATFMDFRVGQERGTTFVYVMPFSGDRALVEFTLFTRELLPPAAYDQGLRDYIGQFLTKGEYKIVEEEFGIIPMTDHRFPQGEGHLIQLGTAGGQTKGSSGYTFRFIQKHSDLIIQRLKQGRSPLVNTMPWRFRFYDSVLLNILYNHTLPGDRIFSRLFEKNKPQAILRFLDNESSLAEELRVIAVLPTWPFFRAALKQL